MTATLNLVFTFSIWIQYQGDIKKQIWPCPLINFFILFCSAETWRRRIWSILDKVSNPSTTITIILSYGFTTKKPLRMIGYLLCSLTKMVCRPARAGFSLALTSPATLGLFSMVVSLGKRLASVFKRPYVQENGLIFISICFSFKAEIPLTSDSVLRLWAVSSSDP